MKVTWCLAALEGGTSALDQGVEKRECEDETMSHVASAQRRQCCSRQGKSFDVHSLEAAIISRHHALISYEFSDT